MPHLNTLLGTLHPEEMGMVAVREHILWGSSGWEFDPRAWPRIAKVFEKSFNELLDFKLLGGQTFVECSGIGAGRDLDFLVKLTAVTGVHVVASTGFWSDAHTPAHFRRYGADDFARLFTHELTVGIGHTRIKAGVISVGNGAGGMSELETAIYRGAVRAAKATGAALITHGIDTARRQIKIFQEELLALPRVVFGDCDRIIDLERDRWLAGLGACVAYDNVGLEAWSDLPYAMPDQWRAELVAQMVASGHGESVMLSAGSKVANLGRGGAHLSNVGNLLRYFVPELEKAGVAQEAIRAILVGNPKRVLPIQRDSAGGAA
ncbi:MAG: phosphotriesterase [Betaproteobacteria bacterium]|nr:phosphotriesterase [Betaproteobacteria bacterium]